MSRHFIKSGHTSCSSATKAHLLITVTSIVKYLLMSIYANVYLPAVFEVCIHLFQ